MTLVCATKPAERKQAKKMLTLEPTAARVSAPSIISCRAHASFRNFAETCPTGSAWSTLGDNNALDVQIIFKGSEALSEDLLRVVVDPDSNAKGKSLQVSVNALSSGASSATGYFQYKIYDEKASTKAKSSHPIRISDHDSLGKALHLKQRNLATGVFIYWDASKSSGATLAGNIRRGDEYLFSVQGNSVSLFNEGDSNTAHRPEQCSGRGSCNFASGKCSCIAGFEGNACQRSKS